MPETVLYLFVWVTERVFLNDFYLERLKLASLAIFLYLSLLFLSLFRRPSSDISKIGS